MRRALGLLAAATAFASSPRTPVALPPYADHTTHKTLTERAVALATRAGEYGELVRFQKTIVDGCIDEDQKPRYLNHFFDPTTGLGLPRNSYSLLFTGQRPRLGEAALRETNAFDWAKSGMPDDRDWEGALAAYDDTSLARKRAYDALGHVIHLLQDMAQPDHATCRQHPGNYAHDQLAALNETVAEYLVPSDRVGYETLWALNDGKWPEGRTPQEIRDLGDAFRAMGFASKAAERELGLLQTARGEKALGLRSYRSARPARGASNRAREVVGEVLSHGLGSTFALWDLAQYAKFEDNLWLDMEVHVPIVPIIPWPETAETKPYLELGRKLLPLAEEASAGLMRHFHDIVNPPPFVESVAIEQDGEPRYFARWQDATQGERIVSRTLVKERAQPLRPGVIATVVRIRFGPYLIVDGQDLREAVRDVRVYLEAPDTSGAAPLEIRGDFVRAAGGSRTEVWEGWFTPQIGGTLRIEARDRDSHLERREPYGDVLDSQPGDCARSGGEAPYDWRGYQPGADRHHALVIEGECDWCTWTDELRKTLRAGTWRGEVTTREETRRDEGWELFYEATAQVALRSLVKHGAWDKGLPLAILELGGADGGFAARWKRGRDDPLRSASGRIGATGFAQLLPEEGQHRHPFWIKLDLEPPEDLELGEMPCSDIFIESQAGPDALRSGSQEEEGSSYRRSTRWSFSFTPDPAPPHAALLPRIEEDEARDLARYHGSISRELESFSLHLRAADAAAISQRIQSILLAGATRQAAHYAGLAERKWAIDRLYDEAHEAWLSHEPGRADERYATKQRELTVAVDAWWAERRSLERTAAASTDELATAVEPKAPELARKLRRMAEDLRTKGSENLGAGSR